MKSVKKLSASRKLSREDEYLSMAEDTRFAEKCFVSVGFTSFSAIYVIFDVVKVEFSLVSLDSVLRLPLSETRLY